MAISYTGAVATPKISGTGLGTQCVFGIENNRNSSHVVTVRRAMVLLDPLAALTAVKPKLCSYRAATPIITAGGVCKLNKAPFDTSQTSDPFVNIWCQLNPDQIGAGGLSCNGETRHGSNMSSRTHDLTGQIRAEDNGLISWLVQDYPFILIPGEAFMVKIEPAAVTSDPATNNWLINAVWTEEPVTTYTISGTVTLSGIGVVGAEVAVLIADDTSLTNAYLWAVVATTSGGAWTCNIPTGKYAYAYAQNDVTGTLYTAPGAPFLS